MSTFQFKYSPTKSPKRPYNFSQSEVQQRPNQGGFKRQSPGTLKKNHPYNDNMTQSTLVEKPTTALKQSLDELEFYRQKCKELESQLQRMDMVVQSGRLDAPLEAYVRENSSLHIELEKLSKQLAQKRNEADLWKQKYENQLSQLMQVKANYELEIQQLSQEVQRLLQKIDEFEYDKQRQVDEVRSYIEQSQQMQLENTKKSFYQQSEMMEMQVRKLREQVNERDNEIDDLNNKLDRLRIDDDNEMQRLLKDNEGLRHRINLIELERQKELESLRNKLEGYSHSTLDNLRKTHMNSIEVLESEIDKLRALLEIKNAEIETLIQQNIKLKSNYETQLSEVRLEVECLKQKLLDGEHIHRAQLEDLQGQMQDESDRELNALKNTYERSLNTVEQEVHNLQQALNNKNDEIQAHLRDKNNQRDYYEQQLVQLNNEVEEQKQHHFMMEREKNREMDALEEEIQRMRIQGQEQRDQLKAQVQFLEGEIQRLKELAHQKNKDLESQINQFSLVKKNLEEDARTIKHENEILRQRVYELERQRSMEFEDVKQRMAQQDQLFRDKSRQYEIKLEGLLLELKRCKEQQDIKGADLENAMQSRNAYEKECRRLKDENENLKGHVIGIEREKVREFEDLRGKLESSSSYQIDNLKTAFNTQLNILHSENTDLRGLLDSKNRDIQDLIEKYQSLESALQTGQFGPEVIANRTICDVYVRTKNRMPSSNKKQ